jgi:hypothetical protein
MLTVDGTNSARLPGVASPNDATGDATESGPHPALTRAAIGLLFRRSTGPAASNGCGGCPEFES